MNAGTDEVETREVLTFEDLGADHPRSPKISVATLPAFQNNTIDRTRQHGVHLSTAPKSGDD